MSDFSIDSFASDVKDAMRDHNDPSDRQAIAASMLAEAIATCGADAIIEALQAAVPPGANIGELIVHGSDELTLLYARVPARFQSGIHNHTVFACVAQLKGEEISTVYDREGDGLTVVGTQTGRIGEVVQLGPDAIHSIANPGDETAHALHLYGGDLAGLAEERTLWDSETHTTEGFSFPALVKQSIKAMQAAGNQRGLDALVEAIPEARAAVEAGAPPV